MLFLAGYMIYEFFRRKPRGIDHAKNISGRFSKKLFETS